MNTQPNGDMALSSADPPDAPTANFQVGLAQGECLSRSIEFEEEHSQGDWMSERAVKSRYWGALSGNTLKFSL